MGLGFRGLGFWGLGLQQNTTMCLGRTLVDSHKLACSGRVFTAGGHSLTPLFTRHFKMIWKPEGKTSCDCFVCKIVGCVVLTCPGFIGAGT